jgi:hypothetical protein
VRHPLIVHSAQGFDAMLAQVGVEAVLAGATRQGKLTV